MTERYVDQPFPLEMEDTWDLLLDYLLMVKDWPQDDKDVKDYREELEHRGFLFITEYDDEQPDQGEEGTILLIDPRTGKYPPLRFWEV